MGANLRRDGRFRLWLIMALMVVGSAPLSSQQIAAADTAGRKCAIERLPDDVRGMGSVLDSVAADSALRGVGSDRLDLLIGVVFNANGSVQRTTLLQRQGPVGAAVPVALALRDRLLLQPASTNTWGVRIRVRQDIAWSFAVEPALRCPPRLIEPTASGANGGPIMRIEVVRSDELPFLIAQRARAAGQAAPKAGLFRTLVDTSGVVIDVQVAQSTDVDEADRMAATYLRGLRFKPASIDGVPVSVWYTYDSKLRRFR